MRRYRSITALPHHLADELTELSKQGWTLVGAPVPITTESKTKLYVLLELEDDSTSVVQLDDHTGSTTDRVARATVRVVGVETITGLDRSLPLAISSRCIATVEGFPSMAGRVSLISELDYRDVLLDALYSDAGVTLSYNAETFVIVGVSGP